MARTCRFLHLECAPLLLTPHRLHLCDSRDIESFCRFMLADTRRRFTLLSRCQSLLLVTDELLSEPVMNLLEEALLHVTTLHSLRFYGFDLIMLSSPRALNTFAALTGVRHLDLDVSNSIMPGKLYVKLLKMLQSPLKGVKLSLPFSGRKYQHVRYDRARDPIWLFSSLSSSLGSTVRTWLITAIQVSSSRY